MERNVVKSGWSIATLVIRALAYSSTSMFTTIACRQRCRLFFSDLSSEETQYMEWYKLDWLGLQEEKSFNKDLAWLSYL